MATIEELESLRWDLRRDCVDIIMAGAGGHIGGDMSVIDALMTLYVNHLNISPETVDDPNRDRFVLSKGHAMEAYYAVLCHEGYLDLDRFTTEEEIDYTIELVRKSIGRLRDLSPLWESK